MSLASDLHNMADQIERQERRLTSASTLLDNLADFYNELTEWTTNTEHSAAAMQVMAILEQYVQKLKIKVNQ